MKYLSEFCVPYDSTFETNILLTSMTFKLNIYIFFYKSYFYCYCYHQNLCFFHSFLYLSEKNCEKFL